MRVLFCGGGTGGHVVPGLAVWEAVRSREPSAEAVFVGTGREGERRFLSGVDHVPAYGTGKSHAAAFLAARRVVRRLRPDVAVGLGGYASVAGVLAAKAAGVRVVLLEQNAVPGRATTLLAPLAAEVYRGLDYLGRGRTVGTPVRGAIAALADLPPARCAVTRSLLVTGGSQGSRAVNDAVLAALAEVRDEVADFRVVHQTGDSDRSRVEAAYRLFGITAEVVGHVDMPSALAAGPVVVGRAGGTTLAELACAGVPAVLIPHALSVRDHQIRNALYAGRFGAGVVEEGRPLAGVLAPLLREPFKRARAATDLRRLARPHAAADVADALRQSAGRVAGRAAA